MELGKTQELTVLYKKDFGIFLGNEGDERGILLPIKQAPENVQIGDKMNVFLYKDSDDRIIATTRTPLIEKEKLAILKVVDQTRIGAFLDWGLEKNLLLPFKEQTTKLVKDQKVLVALYEDRSHRLCGTMKIYKHLKPAHDLYQVNDMVKATVYEINPDLGVFAAVENQYFGLLPKQNVCQKYVLGQTFDARIVHVREDGKLDLDARKQIYQQMSDDAGKLLEIIDSFAGELPFGEKADPALIMRETGMSKASFKRAIGRLLKEDKIITGTNSIKRK